MFVLKNSNGKLMIYLRFSSEVYTQRYWRGCAFGWDYRDSTNPYVIRNWRC